MKNKLIYVASGVGLLAIIAAAIVFSGSEPLTVDSSASYEFTISERMQRVRKILVRTNAVKKIVAMADAELKDQKWLDLNFDAERPILDQDWKLDGEGELQVVLNDAYLGKIQMTLSQQVEISRDRIHVVSHLKESSHSIQQYDSTLTLMPNSDGDAAFSLSLDLQVKTTANFLTRQSVKSGIQSAAQKALENQAEALKQIVEDKEGELIILPELDQD
ncbi:MAG: hypothetical protein AAF939_09560 [Planctomycetota bacterium]